MDLRRISEHETVPNLGLTSLVQTVAPVADPVSLADAKAHMKAEVDDDDDRVEAALAMAVEYLQQVTRRQFVPATYEWRLPWFPRRDGIPLLLPLSPAIAVDSIQYVDVDGATQTWAAASYQTSLGRAPGLVMPLPTDRWPDTQGGRLDAVTVTFRAGYESGNSPEDGTGVPAPIVHAVRLLAAAMFENREDFVVGTIVTEPPMSARRLIAPYRVPWF